LWFAAGFFVSPMALADQKQSEQAQKQTIKVIKAAQNERWSEARQLALATKDTLASKIYFWMLFTQRDDFSDFAVLKRFIRENPDWPGIKGLRAKAERTMPESIAAKNVIAWYTQFPPESARGVDRYAEALMQSGQAETAKKFLADWWATTTLSRDDQRMIFRKYGGYLDRSAHLRRFDAMLLRGENINSLALAEVLGPGYRALAEARIALAQEAGNVEALITRVPPALQRDAGFLYERLRWRRKNDLDTAAIDILKKPPPAQAISNPEEWWKERHIMVRRLLETRQYALAYSLAAAHQQQPQSRAYAEAEWLSGWLALRFLNKPSRAFAHFQDMYRSVETPMSKTRGAYWSARAADAMGDQASAQNWYKDAARFQTFYYGQMAGRVLGLENALPNAAPPQLSNEDLRTLQGDELMQAAKLFSAAGRKGDAQRFLKSFVEKHETPKAYRYAAEKAAEIGGLTQAVRIAKDATSKGMFLTAQSYPVIPEQMKNIKLEWALVHAIIRQESMFDQDALSSAGALGLMQLMPATARETAQKIGIAHQHDWLASKPQHNIRLGSYYLQRLIERFDGSMPMAIAAYNAGPGRVKQWIETFGDPRTGEISMMDWIEMIPIYETRNYVQRVIENVYVYRLRLKTQPQRADHDMQTESNNEPQGKTIRVHIPKSSGGSRAYND
jgi:soluble lytic murein transglycosylase